MTLGPISLGPGLAVSLAGLLVFAALVLGRPSPRPLMPARPAPPQAALVPPTPPTPPGPPGPPGRPQAAVVPSAVIADLVVALLEAGLPVSVALQTLRHHLHEAGLAEPEGLAPIVEALELAADTGLAPGSLVRATASEQRRSEVAAHNVAAHRLGVLVVLPMGLCLLPAFVVLTVVPLVLGLLGG